MNPNGIIIFQKNLEPGQVKTRIARTMGDDKALEIYSQMVQHTHLAVRRLVADKLLFFSSFIEEDYQKLSSYHLFKQEGSDLGARMENAFKRGFELRYKKLVIIGTDCMELTHSIIDQAFHELDAHEVVVGPATDGGYYLLGMKAIHAELFLNKPWSTEKLFDQTMAAIYRKQLKAFILPPLNDIDTEENWRQHLHLHPINDSPEEP